jgi:hypothetical protein
MVINRLDVFANCLGPLGNVGEVSVGKDGEDPAHVAVFPGKDRRIVAVEHAGDGVAVIEDGIDVMLIGSDEGWVSKKILEIGLLVPGKILTDAAARASGAVPNEGDDDLHVELGGNGKSIIRCLESALIELTFFWLYATGTPDGIAHGLRAHDFGAHLGCGGEGIVDFKVRGVAGAKGVVRAITFKAEPFDIRAAEAKGRVVETR